METNYPPKQEPPRPSTPKPREISVTVVRDPISGQFRLNLEPPTVDLTVEEQAAWRSNDGRLEIRFAPNNTPFTGALFRTANGGTILSGAPARNKVSRTAYPYTLLVTTPGGAFVKQDADLRAVDETTGPRPPADGNQGKGCLSLIGLGLIFGLLSKIRAML